MRDTDSRTDSQRGATFLCTNFDGRVPHFTVDRSGQNREDQKRGGVHEVNAWEIPKNSGNSMQLNSGKAGKGVPLRS